MRLLKINLLATVEAIKIDEKNIEYQTWAKYGMNFFFMGSDKKSLQIL